MKITFLGATEEVTGSKYLVENADTKILVDCGMFQGDNELTKRNWNQFPIDPSGIKAVVLTHAHVDHTGYIPALVKQGFKGNIYCSKATYALASILLKDSGLLQEEYAKKVSGSGSPVVPLYTVEDVEKALTFFKVVSYDSAFDLGSLTVKFIQSFHILGSSFIVISDGQETLSFSGDLGRPSQLIMKSPPHLDPTNYLVLESTYGNKFHPHDDPIKELGEIVRQVIEQQGMLIIPAFAVERTQVLLYCLYQLKEKKIIPEIPIYLDSPMATKVTNLFSVFNDEHTLSPQLCKDIFSSVIYIDTIEKSKRLDHIKRPAIIIAGSGMADGGRVLHHIARYVSDAKNIVLFVGFQAEGTHGRALVDGVHIIKIYDRLYAVHAAIKTINSFSAHADANEILDWLSFLKISPKRVFLTHGELDASMALKKKIEERFGWLVIIPKYLESFDLMK